jgi:DNA-binding MarR family transcriptional regulator
MAVPGGATGDSGPDVAPSGPIVIPGRGRYLSEEMSSLTGPRAPRQAHSCQRATIPNGAGFSMPSGYSCDMATANRLMQYAQQTSRVERVLNEVRVAGSPGRVVYLLTLADRIAGVSQKEVVAETTLPKDVVSKLVRSLVAAGLLTQIRETSDPRAKRLATTVAGKDLLRRLKAVLQPPPQPAAEVEGKPGGFDFDTVEEV